MRAPTLTAKHFEAIEDAKDKRARYHGGRFDGRAHMHDLCLLVDVIDRQKQEIIAQSQKAVR